MTPQAEMTNGASGVAGGEVIPHEEVRSQLDKMLSSQTFRAAEGQKSFLKYAVGEVLAGRGSHIKEYLIGVEAFGRGDLFDPRLDPIVRTQARKLRARLAKYYETEGLNDLIRIEFPKGSYVPSFTRASSVSEASMPAPNTADAGAAPVTLEQPAPIIPKLEALVVPTPLPLAWSGNWKVRALLGLSLSLLLATAVFYYFRPVSGDGVMAAGSSIAVLPFVNLNGDGAAEFLSDGLTDDLIDSLGQVPGLRVVARTSAFRFKRKAMSVQEIGQQLRVHAILKGTVRTSGNNLRITAQLINVADGHPLWSGSFDHDTNDARGIQQEISSEVASVFGSHLRHKGNEEEAKEISSNPISEKQHEAYQHYLKGLYLWNKLTADSQKLAIEYFQEAISEDPSFARAYSALADCYVMAPQVLTASPQEVIPKIRAAANKALELDSSLGEAHIDLAICAEYDFDWATAEREFKKGLDLSPDNAVGHLWYAKYLGITGRKAEVLAQRKIATDLDPASAYALQSVGGYLSVMGRYDEAIEQFRCAMALEPNFGLTHQGLGVAYVLKGQSVKGIAELQTALKLMPGPRREALLGWAYGVTGQTAEAQRILSSFLSQSNNAGFPALAVAQVYIGLGDRNRAFEWLSKAADQKDLDLTLKWDSFYDSLRSDSRYQALLRRLKLS